MTKLKPNDRDCGTWQFRPVGWTWPPVNAVFTGPMIEPKASSRSPAPMFAATGAMLSITVDLTRPTVPAAKAPPPTASA